MPNDCPDPGYEEIPSLWTLGSACNVNTAQIQTGIVHSGARALMISSNKIGATTRCGWATVSAPTVPGRRYRVAIWMKSSNLLARAALVRVDGIVRLTCTPPYTDWFRYVSEWFLLAGSSAVVKVEMPSGIAPVVNRYFDDLELEPEVFLDDADPASLAARAGVSAPSSVQGAAGDQNRVSAAVSSLSVQSVLSSLAARASVTKR